MVAPGLEAGSSRSGDRSVRLSARSTGTSCRSRPGHGSVVDHRHRRRHAHHAAGTRPPSAPGAAVHVQGVGLHAHRRLPRRCWTCRPGRLSVVECVIITPRRCRCRPRCRPRSGHVDVGLRRFGVRTVTSRAAHDPGLGADEGARRSNEAAETVHVRVATPRPAMRPDTVVLPPVRTCSEPPSRPPTLSRLDAAVDGLEVLLPNRRRGRLPWRRRRLSAVPDRVTTDTALRRCRRPGRRIAAIGHRPPYRPWWTRPFTGQASRCALSSSVVPDRGQGRVAHDRPTSAVQTHAER